MAICIADRYRNIEFDLPIDVSKVAAISRPTGINGCLIVKIDANAAAGATLSSRAHLRPIGIVTVSLTNSEELPTKFNKAVPVKKTRSLRVS